MWVLTFALKDARRLHKRVGDFLKFLVEQAVPELSFFGLLLLKNALFFLGRARDSNFSLFLQVRSNLAKIEFLNVSHS